MSATAKKTLNNLSKFVYFAFKKRNPSKLHCVYYEIYLFLYLDVKILLLRKNVNTNFAHSYMYDGSLIHVRMFDG